MRSFYVVVAILLVGCCSGRGVLGADESLPPQSLDELWGTYDPRAEPLEAETLEEREQDGIVCRVVRYRIGTFKGAPATMVGFYAFQKGGTKLPGLLQIHGGQSTWASAAERPPRERCGRGRPVSVSGRSI
jgi:hypothetical protein